MRYDLNRLGDTQFEAMAQALLKKVIGSELSPLVQAETWVERQPLKAQHPIHQQLIIGQDLGYFKSNFMTSIS